MKMFNLSLDPEKSLVENLVSEVRDCDVMIGIFKGKAGQKHYEDMKAYLLKLIIEVKGND